MVLFKQSYKLYLNVKIYVENSQVPPFANQKQGDL